MILDTVRFHDKKIESSHNRSVHKWSFRIDHLPGTWYYSLTNTRNQIIISITHQVKLCIFIESHIWFYWQLFSFYKIYWLFFEYFLNFFVWINKLKNRIDTMPHLEPTDCESQVNSDKTIYQDVLQLWKNRKFLTNSCYHFYFTYCFFIFCILFFYSGKFFYVFLWK